MDRAPAEGSANRSSPREHWLCPRCAIAQTPTLIARAREPASRAPTGRRTNCLQKQSSPYIHRVQHTVLSVAGLKGTMSEAELHLIRARMRGGVLNKAKRGELETPLPFGFAYDDEGRVVLDPDQQVQQAVRTVFEMFRRVGSALGVAKHFREHGLRC